MMAKHYLEFDAMGSASSIIVYASSPEDAARLALLGRERIDQLEKCWSRFIPSSELSQLNAQSGQGFIEVSPELLTLVSTMVSSWNLTGGLTDATVYYSMRKIGYDEDFSIVAAREGALDMESLSLLPAPGMAGVCIDEVWNRVLLPEGVSLDPGAVGKGLAGDLVTRDLMTAGATGVIVNLGGDVVFAGASDEGGDWVIEVENLVSPQKSSTVSVPSGQTVGVATSGVLKKRWGSFHHVIDPRTGLNSSGDILQVSVLAPSGWWAEASATAALVEGSAALSWLGNSDVAALIVRKDGVPQLVGDINRLRHEAYA